MSKLRRFLVALAAAYMVLLAGLLWVMHRPILFGEVMRHVPDSMMIVVPFKQLWFVARAGRLEIGDVAPEFNLPTPDQKFFVSLASFRGQKPVVLVFGSYT